MPLGPLDIDNVVPTPYMSGIKFYCSLIVNAQWDEEVTVEVDSNYEFDCEARDDEFVLWYKVENGQDVELMFSDRIFFPSYDSVELRKMRVDDAGVYKCKSTGLSATSGVILKTFKISVIGE